MSLTGIGYDSHRLAEGRRLILGGVEIPGELGLDELQPLLLGGQGQLDAGHLGVARQAGRNFRQVLD